MAVAALRAGKHVLVEKAIALTPEEADAMLRAAADAGRLLMVAHVLPFVPEFAFAAEAVPRRHVRQAAGRPLQARHLAAGLVGRHRRRRQDRRPGRGPAHPRHALHRPDRGRAGAVFSSGLARTDGSVDYLTTQYLYGPGGPAVSCSSGAVAHEGPAVRPRLRNLSGKGDIGVSNRRRRR